jgi:hypothetical protein
LFHEAKKIVRILNQNKVEPKQTETGQMKIKSKKKSNQSETKRNKVKQGETNGEKKTKKG